MDKLTERGAEGFVIDLRGNGGGLLDEAVLTSSVFVEDGVDRLHQGPHPARQDLRGASATPSSRGPPWS